MDYKDLVKLGFVRREYSDSVFEERYGYTPFDLMFERGNVSMSWSPLEIYEVKLYFNEKLYNTLRTLPSVEDVIKCFNK